MATLKTACERICKTVENDAESRAKQYNTMLANCLLNSLSLTTKVQLLTYPNEYTFNGMEYAPVMSKVIICLATINSIATTQTLRDNLQNLSVFVVTVSGNIDKINTEFDSNYSQILDRGVTIQQPPQHHIQCIPGRSLLPFRTYMKQKNNGYLDRSLAMTHKALMAYGKAYSDYLKNTGQWGAKSPDNEKILAMAAKINALKGQLKLDPNFRAIAKDKKKEDKGENKGKTKNKKDNSNKKYQKKDEAWKKMPLNGGEKKTKEVGKFTFN